MSIIRDNVFIEEDWPNVLKVKVIAITITMHMWKY